MKESDRCELHPATDRWMMGDRYGTIVRVDGGSVRVILDRSGKAFWYKRECIGKVLPPFRPIDGNKDSEV